MSETAAPKPPSMQRIPLATESATSDVPSESLEQLINFYVEKAPDQARSPTELRSTPGLASASIGPFGIGPVYAMNTDLPGRLYIVSGTAAGGAHLWEVTDSGITDMGPVGVPTGVQPMVTIAVGPTMVVACSPPACFASSVSSSSFHPILGFVSSPFPGASSVAYLDGYFVFTGFGNTTQFFCTPLYDPDSISAVNFAYADAQPNVVRRVISHLSRLWFLGGSGIEIWYDSGDADFPFRRDAGGFIPHGNMSPRGAAVCDGSIFWLGIDGIVYRTNGYSARRVSTHAVERRLDIIFGGSGVPGNLVQTAFSFVEDGHAMFALTVGGTTFVYDCATERWHDRSSSTNGVGRWLPNSCALSGNLLFGDSATGSIYVSADAATTDGTTPVKHIAVTPPICGGTRRLFMDRLEVECELGGNAMTLDWTDDGSTWSGGRTLPVAGKRAYTTRLGSFRNRSLRLTVSGRARLHALDAQIESGNT